MVGRDEELALLSEGRRRDCDMGSPLFDDTERLEGCRYNSWGDLSSSDVDSGILSGLGFELFFSSPSSGGAQ